uniref:Uncharacterized protein n=1 Tax=Arundo donax TaxID=35708 RepID=A0A0A9U9D2_ARUDO
MDGLKSGSLMGMYRSLLFQVCTRLLMRLCCRPVVRAGVDRLSKPWPWNCR